MIALASDAESFSVLITFHRVYERKVLSRGEKRAIEATIEALARTGLTGSLGKAGVSPRFLTPRAMPGVYHRPMRHLFPVATLVARRRGRGARRGDSPHMTGGYTRRDRVRGVDRVSSHRRLPLLPTTVVGSYPQPNWLVDHEKLLGRRMPPRVRAREVWRVPEPYLEEAQDDATVLAVRDLERAGIDILTDGEMRRESYSNHFSNVLDGVDVENPAVGLSRRGLPDILPRIVGPIKRSRPVNVRDVQVLRAATDRAIKLTVPGPFTMSQQAVDEFYGDESKAAMEYAVALNEEIHDLVAAGADVIQIDEPYMQARLENARKFAIPAINRALEGVQATTVLHTCFGYGVLVGNKDSDTYQAYPFLEELRDSAVDQISIEAAQPKLDLSVLGRMGDKTIMLGVIDCGTEEVETVETVADRIRAALRHLPPERLVLAPDCGMKYLPRAAAFGKLKAMADAARIVRAELGAE